MNITKIDELIHKPVKFEKLEQIYEFIDSKLRFNSDVQGWEVDKEALTLKVFLSSLPENKEEDHDLSL